MTGQGFTSTYYPYKNERSTEKDADPYSSQSHTNDKSNLGGRDFSSRLKNDIKNYKQSIFEAQNRCQSQAAQRGKGEDPLLQSQKVKTSNWLFSKLKPKAENSRNKLNTTFSVERKRKGRSNFMNKRQMMLKKNTTKTFNRFEM